MSGRPCRSTSSRTPTIRSTNPELFEGVLARRVVAFLIDFLIIAVPVVLAAMFIFAFGIVTLGPRLGAVLAAAAGAGDLGASSISALTLGGPRSATIGMRVMDLEMRTWYGAPAYFVLGAVHAIVFWFTVSVLHAVRPAGLLFQPAPAAAARHPARHRRHQ